MLDRVSLLLARVATLDLREIKRDEEGQGVTEYGLVLAFVAIALAAVLGTLNAEIKDFITTVGNDLAALPGSFS